MTGLDQRSLPMFRFYAILSLGIPRNVFNMPMSRN